MSDIDWSVLEIEGVMDVAERAARRLTNEWAPTFEFDDVLQEAYIMLAKNGQRVHYAMTDGHGLGQVFHELWSDLLNYARAENLKRSIRLKVKDVDGEFTTQLVSHTSLDAIIERVGE